MTDLVRQEIVTSTRRVVVKVGTRVLTHEDGSLHHPRIDRLADDLCDLMDRGHQVVLVSSGAVGAGMSDLEITRRPTDVAMLQAVAAVGQASLINTYNRTFRRRGRQAAQVLLTADDLNHRVRYLNVRHTLSTLLRLGTVPIINENDTVAVDELVTTFGDNDRLAALVTNLLQAELLVILSDVDGLYDRTPTDPAARLVPTVTEMTDEIMELAKGSTSGLGTGGMASKLAAAQIVTSAGENVMVASGHRDGVLCDLLQGKPLGTLFIAQGKTVSPWKRWIGYSAQPRGRLILDPGAVQAVSHQGRSLLAIGITSVDGSFDKGDVVSLLSPERREIARGLINYSAHEVQRIMGKQSECFAEILGYASYDEVVHRDHMFVPS